MPGRLRRIRRDEDAGAIEATREDRGDRGDQHERMVAVVHLNSDVSMTDADDGVVLLDGRAGRYWQLNGSGALALRALLGGGTVDDAAEELVRSYPVAPREAARDVTELVAGLDAAGLLTTGPDDSDSGASGPGDRGHSGPGHSDSDSGRAAGGPGDVEP